MSGFTPLYAFCFDSTGKLACVNRSKIQIISYVKSDLKPLGS